MANGDAFDDAVRLRVRTPKLDIGCHLVLVQGRSFSAESYCQKGLPAVLGHSHRARLDPYPEFRAQVEKIRSAGIRPTHLDTHKHTHLCLIVFRAVVRLAHEFGIPYVRLPLDETVPFSAWAMRTRQEILSCFGTRVRRANDGPLPRVPADWIVNRREFCRALKSLPDGTTEFMCHPGFLGPEIASGGHAI